MGWAGATAEGAGEATGADARDVVGVAVGVRTAVAGGSAAVNLAGCWVLGTGAAGVVSAVGAAGVERGEALLAAGGATVAVWTLGYRLGGWNGDAADRLALHLIELIDLGS